MAVALVVLAFVAFFFGVLLWEPYWKSWSETRAKQLACYHDWTVEQIKLQGARYYSRRCRVCGKQEPCNEDGSER